MKNKNDKLSKLCKSFITFLYHQLFGNYNIQLRYNKQLTLNQNIIMNIFQMEQNLVTDLIFQSEVQYVQQQAEKELQSREYGSKRPISLNCTGILKYSHKKQMIKTPKLNKTKCYFNTRLESPRTPKVGKSLTMRNFNQQFSQKPKIITKTPNIENNLNSSRILSRILSTRQRYRHNQINNPQQTMENNNKEWFHRPKQFQKKYYHLPNHNIAGKQDQVRGCRIHYLRKSQKKP